MKKLSVLMLMFGWAIWAGALHSSGYNVQKRKQLPPVSNPTEKPNMDDKEEDRATSGKVEQLAAGNRSTIFESLVLIARDSRAYDALRAASPDLPEQRPEFFETNAVVAAYLGQRRTSGYAIEITNGPKGSLRIAEHAPSKDAMVKMVLTAPFMIVAMPVQVDQPIVLALDETWKSRLRIYRVTSGELSVTGGFAGVNHNSQLAGTIGIMRVGELATFIFELSSQDAQKTTKHLNDTASGLVRDGASVSLPKLNSHTFTGAIQSPFRVTGELLNDQRELRLSLQTFSSANISDNFSATAQLRALGTEPPSRKIQ